MNIHLRVNVASEYEYLHSLKVASGEKLFDTTEEEQKKIPLSSKNILMKGDNRCFGPEEKPGIFAIASILSRNMNIYQTRKRKIQYLIRRDKKRQVCGK